MNFNKDFSNEIEKMVSNWKKLNENYYSLEKISQIPWADIILGEDKCNGKFNLNECFVACAKNAGPVALLRRKNELIYGDTNYLKDNLCIFTSTGYLLSKHVWKNKKDTIYMGFTDDEILIIVTIDAQIFLKNPEGDIENKNFYDQFGGKFVEGAKIYKNSLIVITSDKKIYQINLFANFDINLLCESYSPRRTLIPEICENFCIIPPEISQTKTLELIIPNFYEENSQNSENNGGFYWIVQGKIFYYNKLIDNEGNQCKIGRIHKLFLEENYKLLCLFADDENLIIVRPDTFLKKFRKLLVLHGVPNSIEFCGSICLSYEDKVVILGNNDEEIEFEIKTGTGFFCFSEIDGIRIYTEFEEYFLQKIPDFFVNTISNQNQDLSNIIYEIYKEYKMRDPISEPKICEILQNSEYEILPAIKNLILTAASQMSTKFQKYFFKIVQFARICFKPYNFDTEKYTNLLKILRILNTMRKPEYGRLLTFEEFEQLGNKKILGILRKYHQYFLAVDYYKVLEKEDIGFLYEEWAIYFMKKESKIKVPLAKSESDICEEIMRKISKIPNISYKKLALCASEIGYHKIASKLSENTDPIQGKIPILIKSQNYKEALEIALQNCEFDIIHLIISTMVKDAISVNDIIRIFSRVQNLAEGGENPCKMLISYAVWRKKINKNDTFLDKMFEELHKFDRKIKEHARILEIFDETNIWELEDLILIKNILALQSCKDQDLQCQKIISIKSPNIVFNQSPLIESILKSYRKFLLLKKDSSKAPKPSPEFLQSDGALYGFSKLISERESAKNIDLSELSKKLDIPREQLFLVKLVNYARKGLWVDFNDTVKKEKNLPSNITNILLADLCLEQNNKEMAINYIRQISDNEEKIDRLIKIEYFKEAIEIAIKSENSYLLEKIQESTKMDLKPIIEEAIKNRPKGLFENIGSLFKQK